MRGPFSIGINIRAALIASVIGVTLTLAATGVIGNASADPNSPPPESESPISQLESRSDLIDIGSNRGQQAPPIEAETYTGDGVFRLSDHLGHPVVINFWFPSCSGCRIEKPFIKAAYEKFSGQGVVFLGVQSTILDSVEDGLEFLEGNGLEYPNIADDWAVPLRYKVFGYPQTIFLNSDHTVQTRSGTIFNQGTIDQIIEGILSLDAG